MIFEIRTQSGLCLSQERQGSEGGTNSNLVDPASSHTLVSKIKPCMCKYKRLYTVKLRTAHYISYSLFDKYLTTWITVVILELIHATSPDLTEGMYLLDINHLAPAVFGES